MLPRCVGAQRNSFPNSELQYAGCGALVRGYAGKNINDKSIKKVLIERAEFAILNFISKGD